MRKVMKSIYKMIRKHEYIVIARHVGPDPDALGAQLGLKEMILNTFPKKHVLAVGAPTARFRFMGELDKVPTTINEDALLIIVDTPDQKRVDGVDVSTFKTSIKIDHHPFMESFCTYEWIDPTASSAAQMIIELGLKTPLKLNQRAAENLFVGVIADTNRFLFEYTSVKTLALIQPLMQQFKLDITALYEKLYLRELKEIRLQGYLATNLIVTENGLGYIILTNDILKEYNVDAGSAGNLVNSFNYIKEVLVWVTISEDIKQELIRVNLRSRGPVINKIAEQYQGGGHAYASGARPKDFDEVQALIKELDELCQTYKEEKGQSEV